MSTMSRETMTSRPALPAEPATGNYFVAAYPPFSCWRPDCVGAVRRVLARPNLETSQSALGLYLHIPFCAHRCQYCYYLSHAGQTRHQMEEYVDAVLRELAQYRRVTAVAGRKVGFVYFGGGTPSLLPLATLRRLLDGVQELFPWTDAEEITFECAPRSVTASKLRALRAAGVNRLSLGIQQLNDAVLAANGRTHLVNDVLRAWDAIRAIDFDEVNVDLIAGLVGETEESFRASLEGVLQLGPESVTIYQLEVPPNTPLYRTLGSPTVYLDLPSWAEKRGRLSWAFSRLAEAGYALRSAYAAARNARHRRFVYQEEQYRGADLLGVGTSAFSYIGGAHFQNEAGQKAYLNAIGEGRLPIARGHLLSQVERLVREFVLQLKLGRVEVARFRERYGMHATDWFREPLACCAALGLLTYDAHAVTLTREGLLRVDRLLEFFYLPQHRGLRYW